MRKKSGESAVMENYAFWNPSHTSHDRDYQHFQGFKWKSSSENKIMIKARASLYAGFDNDQLCCCAGVQTHATSSSKAHG